MRFRDYSKLYINGEIDAEIDLKKLRIVKNYQFIMIETTNKKP